LAKRRADEARRSAAVIGIEYLVMDIQSNELTPIVPYRKTIIRLIREYQPHLIATHRPNDYHPDHRYTSQLVQDAAYSVTVPGVCSLTPHLPKDPVIVYVSDTFQRPYAFQGDVVVAIDAVIEKKMDMLNCHDSQVYEWLPYNGGYLAEVPKTPTQRRKWLGTRYKPRDVEVANRFRARLIELYGEKKGNAVRYAEAFEGCEYGGRLTDENRGRLFPFLPNASR
jgi:LmbE family N-acetylglucosaminyl deacetylase